MSISGPHHFAHSGSILERDDESRQGPHQCHELVQDGGAAKTVEVVPQVKLERVVNVGHLGLYRGGGARKGSSRIIPEGGGGPHWTGRVGVEGDCGVRAMHTEKSLYISGCTGRGRTGHAQNRGQGGKRRGAARRASLPGKGRGCAGSGRFVLRPPPSHNLVRLRPVELPRELAPTLVDQE
eukprot:scaffold17893_cov81-Isochrysis_galbana.AAC.1